MPADAAGKAVMATLNLRRFSRPESLKAIRGDHLVALLDPFRGHFRGRGVDLPPAGSGEPPDYERLADVFMRADDETPRPLLNTIYYIDELSDVDRLDEVLDAFEAKGLVIENDGKQSAADVVVQAWLLDAELVQEIHAGRQVNRARSFEAYRPSSPTSAVWREPTDATRRTMEAAFDDWFESKRRGRGSKIFVFTDADPYWILVRHGMPLERAGVIEGGKSSGVVFRPEIYDVLAYDRATGELRVHASTNGEVNLYRKLIGRHVFGSDTHFARHVEYTLAPLRDRGAAALDCEDVPGIEWILLRHIEIWHGGPLSEVEIHRADDVFGAFAARGRDRLPTSGKLHCAKFEVKFSDAPSSRMVTVRLPMSTQYVRDDDSTILEGWLRSQKFIIET